MQQQEQRKMLEQDRARLNQLVIEEFRTHKGKVGGLWEGMPMLLLTTTGAKSGKTHITPLNYFSAEERLFVFAANGGAPNNPDWYYNLCKNPTVTVEIGTERFLVTAVVLETAESEQVSRKHMEYLVKQGNLQGKITMPGREIPVIELIRQND